MVTHPPTKPAGTALAWPSDVLLAERGGFAGFLMPRADGPRVFEFYNPVTRRATAPGFHAGLLHRAGRNLAAAFHALHDAGYVVGDVNESNLLVSPADASVTLVDADSLQVRDEERGDVFRSRVGKPEFTPPELLGMDFGEVNRTPEHDRFGLAVLLFLLLMEGTHPFAARMDAREEALPVEERIRQGLFPHARADDACCGWDRLLESSSSPSTRATPAPPAPARAAAYETRHQGSTIVAVPPGPNAVTRNWRYCAWNSAIGSITSSGMSRSGKGSAPTTGTP